METFDTISSTTVVYPPPPNFPAAEKELRAPNGGLFVINNGHFRFLTFMLVRISLVNG